MLDIEAHFGDTRRSIHAPMGSTTSRGGAGVLGEWVSWARVQRLEACVQTVKGTTLEIDALRPRAHTCGVTSQAAPRAAGAWPAGGGVGGEGPVAHEGCTRSSRVTPAAHFFADFSTHITSPQ